MKTLQEAPLTQEVQEAWIKKDTQKRLLRTLNLTLSICFKVKPGKFYKQFKELELESLEELSEIAQTAQSLADFEKQLTKMLP